MDYCDEYFMQCCFDLAWFGVGFIFFNLMVGVVIVYEGWIIGEGYYWVYGEVYVEVNVVKSVVLVD